MVRQEFHVRDFDVFLEAVEFDAVLIVNIDIFLLRNCKILIVV